VRGERSRRADRDRVGFFIDERAALPDGFSDYRTSSWLVLNVSECAVNRPLASSNRSLSSRDKLIPLGMTRREHEFP